MSPIEKISQFTVPIPLEAHQLAQQFRARQTETAKGKQVYLNTLAAYAMHDYLQMFEVETDLATSASWDPMAQSLLDTGALHIVEQGQLECRPVLPDAQSCYIPSDVWSNRLGYVAIRFDPQLTQATLLGFLPQTSVEQVPIGDFHLLAELFDYLESSVSAVGSAVTQLSQWLQDISQAGWQLIETIRAPSQPALAFRNQAALGMQRPGEVMRGKLLDFDLPDLDNSLALLIGIAPTDTAAFNIRVKVLPIGEAAQLPPALEVSILDEEGECVMQAQARETKTLELQFGGEVGDRFSICLMLNDRCLYERFAI
ncbi:MAG: DUF1822 family protein [Leptolyngbya sp. SIO4C1]|nr:DUF1822 family protein [Leptolyngbya sp. SIO4C1]